MDDIAGAPARGVASRRPSLGKVAVVALLCSTLGGMGAFIVIQQQEINDLKANNSKSCNQINDRAGYIVSPHGRSAEQVDRELQTDWLTAANLVLQNPDCFDAEVRAKMQTTKEVITRQASDDALRQAVCDASDKPFWDC